MFYPGCIPFFPFYSSDNMSDRGYIEYGYLNIALVEMSNKKVMQLPPLLLWFLGP